MAKKYTTSSDPSQQVNNRANAKSSAAFKEETDKVNVKMRATAFDAIVSANPNVTSFSELMRIIKVEVKKPAASRIVAFNTGILSENTGSVSRTNFFVGENGQTHKTSRMAAWSGEADTKSGRSNLSPILKPEKAPLYKIKELQKKNKKIKII